MGNHGEVQLHFGKDEEESMKVTPRRQISSVNLIQQQPKSSTKTKGTYQRWLRIGVYIFLLLAGQSVGVMLGRLYFDKGFICTVLASAGYGLMLSLTQLAFKKVIKKESFKAVMDMIIYQSIVASSVIFIGLFASGEWKTLKGEMDEFHLGKVSYIMILLWTAISWQLFTIGCVGLIFDVSSLFSNAISVLGLPIVPVFAVIFFHDKMNGIKIVAMILAVWGFVSYGYQNYLDDFKDSSKVENRDNSNEVSTEIVHVRP
ncbi:hypothetical protein IC582_029214 [Cucumis melo]